MSVAVAPRYDRGWVPACNEAIYARPSACILTMAESSRPLNATSNDFESQNFKHAGILKCLNLDEGGVRGLNNSRGKGFLKTEQQFGVKNFEPKHIGNTGVRHSPSGPRDTTPQVRRREGQDLPKDFLKQDSPFNVIFLPLHSESKQLQPTVREFDSGPADQSARPFVENPWTTFKKSSHGYGQYELCVNVWGLDIRHSRRDIIDTTYASLQVVGFCGAHIYSFFLPPILSIASLPGLSTDPFLRAERCARASRGGDVRLRRPTPTHRRLGPGHQPMARLACVFLLSSGESRVASRDCLRCTSYAADASINPHSRLPAQTSPLCLSGLPIYAPSAPHSIASSPKITTPALRVCYTASTPAFRSLLLPYFPCPYLETRGSIFSRRCSSAAGWGPPSSAAGDAHGLVRRGGCGAGLDVPEPYSSAFAMNLTGAIRILEGKNASTHIACWPFRLSIVNECHVVPRSRSVPPLAPSVSRRLGARAPIAMDRSGAEGAAREARYVGVGKTDEGARWEPVGLAPAMYVRIPPHAALHFCAVSYGYSCWVYAWCIALFPIPLRTVYAGSSMVGTGLMLLSCSSSGAGVGTVRQGVRGVCGQNVLWEGYCARRGIRVRVLEEEC
ncbi:hypothetical protein B0H13DRAFT_2290518 [Mycena leptocephala]|nr:hypothetical protein B0H13DRAFT_2290518 [Mycena leptocephala]